MVYLNFKGYEKDYWISGSLTIDWHEVKLGAHMFHLHCCFEQNKNNLDNSKWQIDTLSREGFYLTSAIEKHK